MKELIDQLDFRERRIGGVLCILLAAAVLFLAFVLIKERSTAGGAANRVQVERSNFNKLNAQRIEAQQDFQRWQDAVRDMQDLKNSYFYSEQSAEQKLRLDLQRIFSASGLDWSQIKYDYSDFTAEGIQKVDISFTFSGSYGGLKRFLAAIERHPKFLFVERISFTTINPQGGQLELKINLAGYHEQ